MSEEKIEVETKKPEPTALRRALDKLSGAPTEAQVEQLKVTHGEVFCSAFSETEIYFWRPLRRHEYRDLQSMLARGEIDQMKYEEEVVNVCMLWPEMGPHGVLLLSKKAGTLSTLGEQIMQNSNFLPPQLAANLVQKL